MPRSKVRNARMLWLGEGSYGVPTFGAAPTALTAKLAADANPGAVALTWDTDPNAESVVAGDILEIGRSDQDDIEYYKVKSDYVSGTAMNLDVDTPVILKRDSGYSAKRVTDVTGFKRVPGFIGTTLVPNIPLLESGELSATKGIQDVRPDVIGLAGDISLQVGIANSGALLRDVLNSVYYQDGTKVSPAVDGTLNGAVSAGGTQIIVTAVTAGWAAGDIAKLNDGVKSEIVKFDSAWDGISTTIPLDATTPLMYDHADLTPVEELDTTKPYVHIVDRGDSTPSNSFIVQFTDSGKLALYRGVKFTAFNMSVSPNNGLLTVSMSVIAKSVQLLDEYIFGAPTTYTHKPLTNWETTVYQGGVVLPRVTEHSITVDNQTETDGYEEGSRLIGTADEDRGRCEASMTYKHFDNEKFKDIFFENEKALKFVTTYKAAGSIGEAFEVRINKARFGGDGFVQVPASGFINGQSQIMAINDGVTDVQFRISNANLRLA